MSKVIKHYEYLHTIPEIGFEEVKTSAYLADQLEKAGFQTTSHVGGTTGIVGVYDSGTAGPTLALRADMDALGHVIDGVHCARHTCGHDAHSSMVLTAAEELIKEKAIQKGRLKIIFQPAEELGTGALAMIKGGAIDDVDMLLGLHIRPAEECKTGQAIPAMYYSASGTIETVIAGVPAHGARPHLGVNAIDAAVGAINAVNAIHLNPNFSYSAKATKFLCDSGVTNAIPAEAHVFWDIRAQFNSTMDELRTKVLQAIQTGAATVGAKAEAKVIKEIPAAELDEEMTAILADSIREALGDEGLLKPFSTPGGEDFFFYTREKPEIKAGFFGLGVNATPGLHHPDMHFDIEALDSGVEILKIAVKKILG
ncbi:peptidase M20 [Anaerosporomusa subterranea]|uniref:Peptidase M20 n=1 Tax=Anaerosporomusa subterranea TaxID=1794912 RepID=A0A154BNP7_ANASB|nr:M20 peptidase aminoacylase family protein [Anaerosporomusa subterranea]KYZ75505.1 peptidase M20 [Anaerosporomusa subterranea]